MAIQIFLLVTSFIIPKGIIHKNIFWLELKDNKRIIKIEKKGDLYSANSKVGEFVIIRQKDLSLLCKVKKEFRNVRFDKAKIYLDVREDKQKTDNKISVKKRKSRTDSFTIRGVRFRRVNRDLFISDSFSVTTSFSVNLLNKIINDYNGVRGECNLLSEDDVRGNIKYFMSLVRKNSVLVLKSGELRIAMKNNKSIIFENINDGTIKQFAREIKFYLTIRERR